MSKNDEILLKLTDAQWSSATIKCEKSFSILWHNEIVKMLKHLLGNRKVATTVVSHLSSSAHSACYTSYRLITNKSQLPKMPQNSKEYNFKILNGFIFFWQSKLKHSSLDHGITPRPLLFCAQPTPHYQLTLIQLIALTYQGFIFLSQPHCADHTAKHAGTVIVQYC